MNIEVSYNWIKEYVGVKDRAEEFARKLSLSGPSVERLYPQGTAFANMVVGRVLEVKPHPNADKLRIAIVDLGGEQPATIVCGGVNLAADMKVAVALVGAMVKWHGEGDLVKLEPATIRGVQSMGMICAADEIGLAAAFPHAPMEIMDLSWCKARPGTSIEKALELDDTVFDIEVTTNRVDAFSVIGLAREAGAILQEKFSWKEPILPSVAKAATRPSLDVKNRVEKLCTRYTAAVMENVSVGPSPWWMKKRLLMSGIRPINNIVDITNYVMLEYGQPMHAFDYEKLAGRKIVVRKADSGEKILALDGKEYEFEAGQMVIADAERPVAVAGVMGGEMTGVTEGTRTIVFEAATFDPVHVRRTARALNLHSDSSLRFEKGLPEELPPLALARAVELVEKVATGHLANDHVDLWPNPTKRVKFTFRPERAEELIGVCVPRTLMTKILKSLGFGVAKVGDAKTQKYEVTVPYWRVRDIEDERDFAEEIARIYGYHNIPSIMPDGPLPMVQPDPLIAAEVTTKRFLAGVGCTEMMPYSMVSSELMEKAGESPKKAIRISNPLSVDFEYMRLSLRPGLLAAIAANQGIRANGQVFEIGRAYLPKRGELPKEEPRLVIAVWGPESDETQYRRAKGFMAAYLESRGIHGVTLERQTEDVFWHPGRSVEVKSGKNLLGCLGEVHPAVRKRFGLDARVAFVELDLAAVLAASGVGKEYAPVPQYPPALRDLAVIVPERVEYESLATAARDASAELRDIEMFDVYRGESIGQGAKSIAVHLTFADACRTLKSEEADAGVAEVLAVWTERFSARQR